MCLVPQFEPEVIQVAARQWRGETDKVPTTSFRSLTHRGAMLVSRYQKADELELMAQILDSFIPQLAGWVLSVDCDSDYRSFSIKARCGQPGLVKIAHEFFCAALTLSHGHGDITLDGLAGCSHSLDARFNHADWH